MDDFGFWLFVACWVGWIWLMAKRYRRAQDKQAPQSATPPAASYYRGTWQDDESLDGLHIASTPKFISERAAALAAHPVYWLEYADADGVITKRGVTPSSWLGNEVRTHMWCHLRQNWRTFRYDRMMRITQADTGEELNAATLYLTLHHGAEPAEKPKPRRATNALSEDAQECWETYADVLTLMAIVGKSDDRFSAKEKAAVREFILERGHTAETADALLKRLGKVQVPAKREVDALLKRLAAEAEPQMRQQVLGLCQQVAEADGTLNEDERYVLGRVQRLLG